VLDLEYDLKGICRRNRDGSYLTQAQREQRLKQIARDLHRLGYRNLRAGSLKPKHVDALIGDWQARELSTGTVKNRLADVRWWAEKTGKPSVVAGDNAHYGIDRRVYVTNDSKATDLAAGALQRVDDEHLRMSLRLQAAFGLRREESIKFQPSFADHDNKLVLKASWCKGGRAREIPIRTPEQRQVLVHAHALAGKGSLIPPERSYVQQRRLFERQTVRAGLSKNHGLRHAYAQNRYQELTGFLAPAAGGPVSRALTSEQKQLDHQARLTISRELGHEREQITAVYLGR
jgi:Integrase/Phage integrase, N-terminal